MAQKLANCQLKYNTFGSTMQLKNVTPAEMLLLVSMFHSRPDGPGGDPIVEKHFKEIPEDSEKKQVEPLMVKLKEIEEKIEETAEEELTDEIREKRTAALLTRQEQLQDQIRSVLEVKSIRDLEPAQEVNRLKQKYGEPKVNALFAGAIPSLPTSFQQAKELGLKQKLTIGFMEDHVVLHEVKAA